MNSMELRESFYDLSKEEFIKRFELCKICPGRILAYFKVYDIEDIEYLMDTEYRESKERLLDDLDMNLKQDLVNLLSY